MYAYFKQNCFYFRDTCRQMIQQKKIDIKVVKKKINMVRTLNELGPQLNVDSDDEDTPYEDDDDSRYDFT